MEVVYKTNKRYILTELELLEFAKNQRRHCASIADRFSGTEASYAVMTAEPPALPSAVEMPDEAEMQRIAKSCTETLTKDGHMHDGSLYYGYTAGMNVILLLLNLK